MKQTENFVFRHRLDFIHEIVIYVELFDLEHIGFELCYFFV